MAIKPLIVRMLLIIGVATVSTLFAKEARKMTDMKLTSSEFVQGKRIPAKYSCDGQEISPPLAIEGVPREAKSLALIMDDPDAPGGTWVHWVLWNIDPATTQIAAGNVPQGAQQGINSWKRKGYGGPCPPSGTHRYFFRLYALKEKIELATSATRKELDQAMRGKVIAETELMGVYSRSD